MSALETAIVFDLGKVVVDWDPEGAVAPLFADRSAAKPALVEAGFFAWMLEQDRGRSWEDGLAAAPDAATRRLYETYWHNIDRAHEPAVPGTADLIERLHAQGIPLFGLTNAAREAAESCRRQHPALTLMRDIVVSGEEGVLKPDPAIYEILIARAGRPASHLVFIDDNAKNVAAAEALGLRGHHFTCAAALETFLEEEGLL